MLLKSQKDYKTMYREIISAAKENNEEKVGELVIIKNGLSHKSYKTNISKSPVAKTLSEKDKKVLKEMLDVVSAYEQKLIEIELPLAKNIINAYIKSDDFNSQKFCENNGLDVETFDRAKKLVSLYDKDKHALLNKEQKVKDLIRRKFISEQVEHIASLLKNGIELENGEIRNFDLIDYYECTDLSPKQLYVSISSKRLLFGDMATFDINGVKKYLFNITSNIFLENPINIENKLGEILEYDCKKDANGRLIQGTGKQVTELEKISLIEYLASKRIPLNEGAYSAGIKRIMNKTFDVQDKKIVNKDVKVLKLNK